MPYVGVIAPQRKAAVVVAPTLLQSLGRNANGSFTLTHSAPTGTKAGDRMMLSLSGYSLSGAQGANGVVNPDANWTLLSSTSSGATDRQTIRLYTKVADAADEAGTSSYGWQMTGGAAYGAIMCSTIPQVNGTTPSVATSNIGFATSYSASVPSGDWLFVAAVGKWYRTGGSGSPIVSVSTSGSTLLASYLTPVEERGEHQHYAVPASAASVTGAMASATVTHPYGGLMVVGLTA